MSVAAQATLIKEPRNTLYVQRWADLNNLTSPATFEVTNDNGESHVIHADRNLRRVLEGLRERPIYCASRCRISHYVNLLRHEKRVQIETDRYSNDAASGRMSYGVFRLVSTIKRVNQSEVPS